MIGIPLRIIINETVLCIGEIFGCSDKVTKKMILSTNSWEICYNNERMKKEYIPKCLQIILA